MRRVIGVELVRPFTLTEIPARLRTPTQVNAKGLLREVHAALCVVV